MLSEKAQYLLTGFIDGVLTREERKAAERLLRESSEAREWLRRLQENAHRVKKLGRVRLDTAFTAEIMAQLQPLPAPEPASPSFAQPSELEPAPILVQKPRLRRGLPSWVVGALAASFVVAVIGGTAWWIREQGVINRTLLPAQAPVVAQHKTPPAPKRVPEPSASEPKRSEIAKNNEPKAFQDLNTTAPSDPVDAKPVTFTFAALKTAKFDSLKWELNQQEAVHIGVQVGYNARSLNRLIEAFAKNDIRLVVPPPAEVSAKKKQPLLVYAENVKSDALAQALQELGEADIQGTKRERSTYETLDVGAARPDDLKRVAQSLGVDADVLKSPGAAAANKGAGRGVILPLQPSEQAAREAKQFLESRPAPAVGTLRVVLELIPQ